MAVVIKYQFNDPTTPELVADMTLPPLTPGYLFRVIGMPTSTPVSGTRDEQAGRAYITLANLTAYAAEAIKKVNPAASPKWAATNSLQVNTRAGKDLNAYYDRMGFRFFLVFDKGKNKFLFFADSADIVAHECGHAILDSIRPDLWSIQALEIWALHEAFGDVTAICSALLYDNMIEKALQETGGDLRKENVVSRLADQVGEFIHRVTGDVNRSPTCLRNAVNSFAYADPKTLPKEGPDNTIFAECHSFARILVGAWYDMLVAIYEKLVATGKTQVEAVKEARDISFSLFIAACCKVPVNGKMTEAVCKMMMEIDRANGGNYVEIMRDIFARRGIVKELKMLSVTALSDLKKGVVTQSGDHQIVSVPGPKKIKLANKYVTSMYVKGTDLSNINLQAASENMYLFDDRGVLVDEVVCTEDEIYEDALLCVEQIKSTNDVGPHVDTKWEIKSNELHRTLIECKCCRH